MPRAARKACSLPGCANTCEPGVARCADHAGRTTPRKSAPEDRMLHSARWRRLSKRVIAEEPTCRLRLVCAGDPSEVADHIVERADGGALFDRANLQGACSRCNVSKGQRSAQARRRQGGMRRDPV